ncbi:MAG: hypothetical protein ACRBN8_22515 [Nannocystales bacterium]
MSIAEQAKDGAVAVINGVTREIANERKSRRKEPRYWANFHEVKMLSLPKWRRVARWWHQNRARHYHSHAAAKRRSER